MSKKKGGSQPRKDPPKCSRMYSRYHEEVATAVAAHIAATPDFNSADTDKGIRNEYSTYVMGTFRCYNSNCSTQLWGSGKVTILIRKYQGGSYNAVVFMQRCEGCNRLGKLKMDKTSYIERVTYRLLKWAGVTPEPPSYRAKKTPPHKAHLCEGCKRGVCRALGL
jgi:hypothetical protein